MGARGGALLAGAVYVAGWFTIVLLAAQGGVFETTPETTVPVIGMPRSRATRWSSSRTFARGGVFRVSRAYDD